jgi:prepilin-type N-terminal cleavage/methylation domain-containing protein
MSNDRGFSLIEMLVSVTIMLAVTAGIFAVMNPAHGTFQTQPEVADMQQRLRVGVDTLYKDLLMAGAGAYSGTQAGSLGNFFAPILPYKQGANPTMDDGALRYRTDGITLMYIPQTVAQTSLRDAMPNESAELKVNKEPGCPPTDDLCGFQEGMTVLIYDDTGSFDTLTITEVQESAMHLQHNQQGPLSKAYCGTTNVPPCNTKVTQIGMHVYYLDTTTNQLMHYDGTTTGVGNPVADNVVGLSFEYWGDPLPPALKKPGSLDLTMTYGPKPESKDLPPDATKYWQPQGSNCVIDATGGSQVSRLPSLGAASGGLVKLNDPADSNTSLTDGPWCPDPNNVNKWDADLLRIRKVVVTIRVQAALAALRGPAGTLFTNGGTSRGANSYAPDQEIKFDVTPRNVNLGR